jgi:choline dehydrogenase
LKIRTVENVNPLTSCFLEACEQRGYKAAGDFNGRDAEGFGLHQLNAYNGERQSAAVAFLHPVQARDNLKVVTRATVRELIVNPGGSRVEEVVYEQAGTLHRVPVQEEVIVAAGAVDSPKLLMLSGIGPASDLERLGIGVRADLQGVGQNLHDHLAATVTYEATRAVPPGRNQNSEAGLYCKSDPNALHYDLQFAFLHIPFLAPGYTHGFTVLGGILKVLSRGSVTLRSADPADPPLIDPAYLSEEEDVRRMLVALEIGQDIASAPAFDEWRGRAVAPGPDVRSEADKRSYLAASATTYGHPVGTCKMGTQDDCVVDPRLMVRGFENLRVADASVIPEIVCANTNAPAMMIGWRVAEMISGRST